MDTGKEKIRIAIGGRDRQELEGLSAYLNSMEGIKVAAVSCEPDYFLKLARERKVDLFLFHVGKAEIWIEMIKDLHAQHPGMGIVVLARSADQSFISELKAAGASGVLAEQEQKFLPYAIKSISLGGFYYSSVVAAKLTVGPVTVSFPPTPLALDGFFEEEELEVIYSICQQLENEEIAIKMGTSLERVEEIRGSIESKTGVNTSVGIAVYALKKGIAVV